MIFHQQIGKAGFETEASEMIKALQVELMAIRLKEAESDHNNKELEAKLEEAVEVRLSSMYERLTSAKGGHKGSYFTSNFNFIKLLSFCAL